MFSCSNKHDQTKALLHGQWRVVDAKVNGKANPFSIGGEFHFLDNDNVTSSLFQDTIVYAFQLKGNTLSIDTPEKFVMNIKNINNDTLLLEGKIKHFQAEYLLIKK